MRRRGDPQGEGGCSSKGRARVGSLGRKAGVLEGEGWGVLEGEGGGPQEGRRGSGGGRGEVLKGEGGCSEGNGGSSKGTVGEGPQGERRVFGREGRGRADRPGLKAFWPRRSLAGGRGVRGREAAASSSEPTTARAASCLFPSGPLLSASFPVDFPVKGPGPPQRRLR